MPFVLWVAPTMNLAASELSVRIIEPMIEFSVVTEQPDVIAKVADTPFDHGNPSGQEQYMLELINYARAHPSEEAQRLGLDLNDGLAPDTIKDAPKPPLAMHPALITAARAHSDWMVTTDTFNHIGIDESSPLERINNAGYLLSGFSGVGENIAWGTSSGDNTMDLTTAIAEIHATLFASPDHRRILLDDRFDEIGIGIIQKGDFQETARALVTTQNFAVTDATPGPILLGVVYQDQNANQRYDIGEGIPNVRVDATTSNYYTLTADAGGYALPLDITNTTSLFNDEITVTFSGSAIGSPVSRTITTDLSMDTQLNTQLDLALTPLPETAVLSVQINGPGQVTSDPDGIDCPGQCSAQFDPETAVQLTAIPDPDTQWLSWSDACAQATSSTCDLTLTSGAQSTLATFEPRPALTQYILTLQAMGPGQLLTNSDLIPSCDEQCEIALPAGTQITITAQPDSTGDAHFVNWEGSSCEANAPTCTITMNQHQVLSAQFAVATDIQQLVITVQGEGTVRTTAGSIVCDDVCVFNQVIGAGGTLVATPAPGWQFVRWQEDCSGTEITCGFSIPQHQNVTAVFESQPALAQYILTLQAMGPGQLLTDSDLIPSCDEQCEIELPTGTQITITAQPDNTGDAQFVNWEGSSCEANAPTCTITMNQHHVLSAQFATATDIQPLGITVQGEGTVRTTAGSIVCDDVCVLNQVVGSGGTLVATPAPGWQFVRWQGDCSGTEITCGFSIPQSQNVTAVFEPVAQDNQQTIQLVVIGQGQITLDDQAATTCSTTCYQQVAQGITFTATATAADGHQFLGWSGACSSAQPEAITNPTCSLESTQSRVVVAVFTGGVTRLDTGGVTRLETTAWRVAEIYMATMGYAPDNEGLQYWIQNIETVPDWTPETVAQSFFDQPLVQAVYPSDQGYSVFIDALYDHLFARDPDQTGYDYWLGELESGQVARQHMIIALINGGWDNASPDAKVDMERFGHRIQVALAFAQYQAEHGIVYSALAEHQQRYLRQVGAAILMTVTTDVASRDAALAQIETLLSPLH
jgi:uncharacterized protein YkwD